MPAALIAFFESRDYEDAVRKAISLGGDADTRGLPRHVFKADQLRARFGRIGGIERGAIAGSARDLLAASFENPGTPVPVDLVTTSASGLDPDISPEAALFQVPRIAKTRNLPQDRIAQLVDDNTEGRLFGLLGEPRVNVLQLNLALDKLAAK